MVASSYADAHAAAVELRDAIASFVADPSEAGLEAARQAWLDAREPYGQTEAFRFYDGPIDNPETGPEGRLNAWPMDEAYVDYVEGMPDAGIINDAASHPTIDAELLSQLNEQGGETNIASGYPAIEFLLWAKICSPTSRCAAVDRLRLERRWHGQQPRSSGHVSARGLRLRGGGSRR